MLANRKIANEDEVSFVSAKIAKHSPAKNGRKITEYKIATPADAPESEREANVCFHALLAASKIPVTPTLQMESHKERNATTIKLGRDFK